MNRTVTRIYDIATGVFTKHPDAEGPHWGGTIASISGANITTAFTAKTGRAPKEGDHCSFYNTAVPDYHLYVYESSDWQPIV
jgi:hypothetical protein